jgi:acyl dehydratase
MEELAGRSYGPYPLRVCREKVDEFITATSDDPRRWSDAAPPGWAAVPLFAVAPHLFADPAVGRSAQSVIHGEQRFRWSGPIPIEQDLTVQGKVTKARERNGVWFVTFDLEAGPMTGSSVFLMSEDSPPAGESEERDESGPSEAGTNDPLSPGAIEFLPLRRSASRADLIRYAAATRDWNPIHWDHRAAVAAGLGGVVAHGLLQAAWMMSAASILRERPDPLAEAKFRFRAPLPAGAPAVVSGLVQGDQLEISLDGNGHQYVSGNLIFR